MPPRNRTLLVFAAVAAVLLFGFLGWRWAWESSRLVPERGGVYVEAVAGQPQYINPLLMHFNEIDHDLASLLFAGLVRVGANGALEPDLARSWDISPDGKTYTFTLQTERKWHDGQPVVVEDVLTTVGLLQDPDFPGLPDVARPWLGVSATKVDERTVRFVLPEAHAPFLEQTTIGILPAHVLAQTKAADLAKHPFNGSPVGAGPFKVLQASVQQVTLVPDTTHPEAEPYLDSLVFRFYPSARAAISALVRGEAHGVRYVPASEVAQLRERDNLRLYGAPQYGRAALIFFNVERAPFDNPSVRAALTKAADRQALVDEALGGLGEPATGPLSPLSWGYNMVEDAGFDRERARSLLADAGWRDSDGDGVLDKNGSPLAFSLATSDAPERVRVANNLAAQFAALGLKVEVSIQTWEEMRDARLVPHDFDAALVEVSLPNRDPDAGAFWHSGEVEEGLNFSGWRNARVDELLDAGRETFDADARRRVYAEFQSIFADEAPALFLYYPTYQYALSAEIKGVKPKALLDPADRLRSLGGWYIHERRVFFP